jgi:hypothetical protein
MVPMISLLVVITLSILITRVATVALTHTGLSKEVSRFQARSAFSGVGYTTRESEQVVNHPVRRRILLLLMLMGNAGIVTAVSSLILAFIQIGTTGSLFYRILVLGGGLVALWSLSASRFVDRHLSHVISLALKRYTRLEVQDYASLLHVAGEYRVTEMLVDQEDWLSGHTLLELRLRDEGVLVLGITREDGRYIGAPEGTTKILANDTLILYGRARAIERLDERRKGAHGDHEHAEAVAEYQEMVREGKDH